VADIEQIVDITGQVRRLGSLAPDTGRLRALMANEGPAVEFTDAEIRRLLEDPNRKPARQLFGDEWICNQGSYGSCNGWATAECIARGRWHRGIRDGITRLSGSYIYAWINGNRDQGSMLTDGREAAEKYGAPPADMVSANLIYRRQMPPGADDAASKHKGFLLASLSSMRALRTALAMQDPCVVAVHAGGNFQRLDSRGIAGVDNGSGNHAVALQDLCLKDGIEVFDMANSWGLQYGQRGCAYLTQNHFRQTFEVHGFWVLRSTTEAD